MKERSFSKKFISVILAVTMLLGMLPAFSALAREYAADFSINGETVAFTNQAYSKNDIIYVPLEELGGYLNLKLSREGDTYTVLRNGAEMKVQIGNLAVFLNGKEIKLPSHPEEKNGVTYVPTELFSTGFGCPVTVSDNKRSADIVPNVYKVAINAENAAATSAITPDKDTLATGTSANDVIFNNLTNYPQMEKSVYYKIDLSAFEGVQFQKVMLGLNIDKSEYNPTLRIVRTAPFTKGEITYNTPPAEYGEYVTGNVAESNFVDKQYNITSLAEAARKNGEPLTIKLMGIPHASKITSKNNSFSIKGVNTSKAPHAILYVEEDYVFPRKAEAAANAGEEYAYSKLALLKSLGVFTESDEFPLDLGEGVQRHEFVKYALRLRNTPASAAKGEQFFSDVPTDAPFYADVMTAYSIGLVSGWQGIAFRPYDRITIGEAITILGRMLNYNILADERGGFTSGYFEAARHGDLYQGSAIEKAELSFNKMFTLLEDALDASMLRVVSYKTDGNAEYIFDENMTVLSEYWNAKLIEGIVNANEYSSLTPGANGKDGKIVINTKELILRYEPYNQFLGYRVKAYYDSNEDVLLYMGIRESDITDINIADIAGTSQSDSSVSFTYKKENGKYGNDSFSRNGNVIYNGKLVAEKKDKTEALLNADGGTVRLVGENLAVITAYRTVVVSSVNITEETVYDTYDSYSRSLVLKDKEWTLTDTAGKKLQLDAISKNDVISVAQSLDGQVVNAIISTKKVSGTIDATENLGGSDALLTIAGYDYELSNRERVVGESEYWTDYLKLGLSATFLIDCGGKIAGAVIQKSEGVIGYLLNMGDKGSAIKKKLQAVVMVKDAEEYVVYDLADKVEIDNRKFSDHSQIETYFTEDSAIKRQPIIFDLNADGKIKKINTPTLGTENGRVVEDEDDNLELRHKSTDEDMNYKSSGIYGGKFFLGQGDNMIIAKGGEEYEDYVIKTSLSNNEFYYIDAWTIGKKSPEVVVALINQASSAPSIGDDPMLYVVDRVVGAIDSDGYEVKKLYYYTGVDTRKSVNVNYKYEDLVKDFKRGDIIRFSTNTHGELHAAKEYYDYETKTLNAKAGGYNALNRVSGGYVGRVDKTYVQIVDYNAADIGNPSEEKLAKELYGTKSDGSYNKDYEYTWFNSKQFKNLFSYEVDGSGITIKKETVDEIRTYEDVPYNPHGLILNAAYENIRANVWLLEMKQPSGTGKCKVSYSGGIHSGAANVPTGFVRYNPGAYADITDKKPTYDQYTFTGWKVNNEGALLNYGDKIEVNGDETTLVAQWVYTPTLKFTFTAGEGSGTSFQVPYALKQIDLVTNASHDLPKASDNGAKDFVAPTGKVLGGWALLDADGNTVKEYKYNIVTDKFDSKFTPADEGYADAQTGGTFKAIWTDTYEISTADELKWFATNGDKSMNVKLTADIYLNDFKDGGVFDEDWYETEANVTAANSWNDYKISGFKGTFDGNNKTIYGLYISGASSDGTGFFSSVAGGTVKNVTFKGAYVVSTAKTLASSGKYTSGANPKPIAVVAGISKTAKSTFENIDVYGKITASANGDILTAAGIVGQISHNADIKDCDSYVNVVDTRTTISDNADGSTAPTVVLKVGAGGIVGYIGDGGSSKYTVTINNCRNYGDIVIPYQSSKLGGIVGHIRNYTVTFTDCGNAGNIKGKSVSSSAEIYGKNTNGTLSGGTTDTLTGGSAAAYTTN